MVRCRTAGQGQAQSLHRIKQKSPLMRKLINRHKRDVSRTAYGFPSAERKGWCNAETREGTSSEGRHGRTAFDPLRCERYSALSCKPCNLQESVLKLIKNKNSFSNLSRSLMVRCRTAGWVRPTPTDIWQGS